MTEYIYITIILLPGLLPFIYVIWLLISAIHSILSCGPDESKFKYDYDHPIDKELESSKESS